MLGLQNFLRDKLPTWANNGSCIEDIWKNFKDIIFDGIKRFVLHKILTLNLDPEYFNKKVKRLKVKVRRAYSRRKLGEHYQVELKRLSKIFLTAKRNAQETFLSSILQNEGKSCSTFYRFVNRCKGNEKYSYDQRLYGGLITDPVDKANNFKNCYASLISCEQDIPDINSTHSDKPVTIKISIIRKRLAMFRRNKSVGPDSIPVTILKMGGEAMILYLARLLDLTIDNGTIPRDCGFRPGSLCESQIITVCQDISDSIDEATRLDVIIIDFSKAFDLVPDDRLLKKLQPRAWIQGWPYR